ncbi:J domain-containing protein [Treponema pectinovorum]|uniref:J domain-containing protein n=1 Tax=Treponema pectinovorum TaxID=164 RepID=UPI003D90D5ED
MKFDFLAFKTFCAKHWILLVFICIGAFSGIFGFIALFFTGILVDLLVQRIFQERKSKRMMEDGKITKKDEPFAGAAYVCALCANSFDDLDFAAQQIKAVFGKKYKAPWVSFCTSAKDASFFNRDLVVESLACSLVKALKKGENPPLKEIFDLLEFSEFNWDTKQGEKPSTYLASLLNYRLKNDELYTAYEILGLKQGVKFSEVKKAHRKLAAKFHPDLKGKTNESEFLRIQKAYEMIAKEFNA